jgi:hypothetical protein
MTAFSVEVLEPYIREDLKELDNPMRKDRGILMQDLRFLFRAYRYSVGENQDWVPAARGREDAPEGALKIEGGN